MKSIINKEIVTTLISILCTLILFITTMNSFAGTAEMNNTLTKIINQLQMIKPLINQAEREQPKNPRIKFHFDRFKDNNGKTHNGLRQDINLIQQALIQAVKRARIEPRSYQPIKGDFVEDSHV